MYPPIPAGLNREEHVAHLSLKPLTGPAWERRTPTDDLFHEPEAQPETVATGAPRKATVSDRRPSPGDTSTDTSLFRS